MISNFNAITNISAGSSNYIISALNTLVQCNAGTHTHTPPGAIYHCNIVGNRTATSTIFVLPLFFFRELMNATIEALNEHQ